MLAPTFDEGTLREAPPEVKHQIGGQHPKRLRWDIALADVPALRPSHIGLALLWLTICYPVHLIRCIRISAGFSRAPPALQLA